MEVGRATPKEVVSTPLFLLKMPIQAKFRLNDTSILGPFFTW
jgi:hypothetical protein